MTRRSVAALPLAGMLFLGLAVGGCQTDSREQILLATHTPVALRAVQTRAFDTTDMNLTVRTVIATLQDLGFVIDKADERLGAVSGTKLDAVLLGPGAGDVPDGERGRLSAVVCLPPMRWSAQPCFCGRER